jgi:galactokinase
VVYENDRVLAMVDALTKGDHNRIGELMYASHASCKNLYDVSCRELDIMVETASKVNGVIGCRMTGAGRGGCAVSLVWDWAVEELRTRVRASYEEKTGISSEIYMCTIRSRAGELSAWN